MTSLLDGRPLSQKRSIEFTSDLLASSTWEEVSPKDTLITPLQCKSIWRQFKAETEYAVAQAMSMQEAHRRSNNWLPPAWTVLLLAVLGFNEFIFLLRNPLYILGLFLGFVLSYAVWLQYDITSYFRHGMLSALLTASASLLPTIMEIITAIVNMSHNKKQSSHPSRRPPPLHAQSFRNNTCQDAQVHYHASPDSPSSVDSNSGEKSSSNWQTYYWKKHFSLQVYFVASVAWCVNWVSTAGSVVKFAILQSSGRLRCFSVAWCKSTVVGSVAKFEVHNMQSSL